MWSGVAVGLAHRKECVALLLAASGQRGRYCYIILLHNTLLELLAWPGQIQLTCLASTANTYKSTMTKGKENNGNAQKIRDLEEEVRHYREELRRREEQVEALKREKARLQASVKAKEAIVAARRQ